MVSKTLAQSIVDKQLAADKLEQFKEEMKQLVGKALKNSNLLELVENYGLTGEDLLSFQCTLDVNKVREFSQTDEGQKASELLPALPHDEEQLSVFAIGWCFPCATWCH